MEVTKSAPVRPVSASIEIDQLHCPHTSTNKSSTANSVTPKPEAPPAITSCAPPLCTKSQDTTDIKLKEEKAVLLTSSDKLQQEVSLLNPANR